MSFYEKVNLFLSLANFTVIAVLTYRITKANEAVTKLQEKIQTDEMPRLSMWVRDKSNKNKELSLINLGKNDLLISYLTVQTSGRTCDWLTPEFAEVTVIDQRALCNLTLRSGKIYTFDFGSDTHGGMYGGSVQFNNMKGDSTLVNFTLSSMGPYTTTDKNFFHY